MNKEILRLAIPNVISNISIPLLSTVDTALMGRLSHIHLGSVGIAAMIFNFIYWNFGFLRMGTTGMAAQEFGGQNQQASAYILIRALLVAFVMALLILIFQSQLGNLGFYLMNVPTDMQPMVEEYFYIRIWAAPATLGSFALMGWFFGMQNAIYPLLITIFVGISNILLSIIFVQYYELDILGVAYGTLLAQYFGLFMGFFFLFWDNRYRKYFHKIQAKILFASQAFLRFLNLNRDIFIRTVCLTFVFGLFYSQSATKGAMILAVNTVLMQFISWMSFGVDGFAFASESLVGKYKGAKDQQRLSQAIRLSFVWGMILAVLYSLVYGLWGESLLWLFSDKQEVILACLPFLIWMFVFPVLATPCYIWDGIFVGLTASKAMRDSMLLAFVVYLFAWFLVPADWGNHKLWLVLLLFLVARTLFQSILYRKSGTALK